MLLKILILLTIVLSFNACSLQKSRSINGIGHPMAATKQSIYEISHLKNYKRAYFFGDYEAMKKVWMLMDAGISITTDLLLLPLDALFPSRDRTKVIRK